MEKAKTVLQVLEQVQEILRDKRRWTCWAFARDRHSARVDVDSPKACRWCLMGAVGKAADDDFSLYENVAKKLSTHLPHRYAEEYIDGFMDAATAVSNYNDDEAIKRSTRYGRAVELVYKTLRNERATTT